MTSTYYEERLRAFAEGKRLGRLAKAVRDPEDGACDACGSTLPRTLFGLRDTVNDRHFFVGQNCLAWLLETGLVARTRYRQSAEVAYRREIELRRNGAVASIDGPSPSPDDQGDLRERRADLRHLRRTFFILETETHYEALVRLEGGRRRVSGRAQEPRWSQGWARHDGGVVLLERVPRARRNAVAICVLKAYRKARTAWRNGAVRNGNEPGNEIREEVVA
ncbi:MAG: hypothetical protein Q8R28_05090 [Dehalococcoidia bacterium]|nr:hypothetical protein [Dehalococcoidia bacterium]